MLKSVPRGVNDLADQYKLRQFFKFRANNSIPTTSLESSSSHHKIIDLAAFDIANRISNSETYVKDLALEEKGHKSVVVIGLTRAGKGTFIKYMAGTKQIVGFNERMMELSIDDDLSVQLCQTDAIKTGASSTSVTKKVAKYHDTENLITYWDCPGFEPTGTLDQAIQDATSIFQLFKSLICIKIVLVISVKTITADSAGDMKNLLKYLAATFSDSFEVIKDSICLVITKTSKNVNIGKVKDIFREILRDFNTDGGLETKEQQILGFFCSDESKIFLFSSPEGNVGSVVHRDDVLIKTAKDFLKQEGNFLSSINVKRAFRLDIKSDLSDILNKQQENMQKLCYEASLEIQMIIKEILNGDQETAKIIRKSLLEIKATLNQEKPITNYDLFNYENAKRLFEKHKGLSNKTFISSDKKVVLEDIYNKLLESLSNLNQIQALGTTLEVLYKVSIWHKVLTEVPLKLITQITGNPSITYEHETLKFSGWILDISYIKTEIEECQNVIKSVQIFGFYKIFFDDDLNLKKLKGNDLVIIAPYWKISTQKANVIIDLSGKKAMDEEIAKAPNANQVEGNLDNGNGKNGLDGEDGIPGNPGQKGGNFIGICGNILNGNRLEINLNGGLGGNGQNGGDGSNGTDAKITNNDLLSQEYFTGQRTPIYMKDSIGFGAKTKYAVKKVFTFNGQCVEEYIKPGNNGGVGGNGGKGGSGGIGGNPGEIKISLGLAEQLPSILKHKGNNGEDGSAGQAGFGGTNEPTYYGEYIIERMFSDARGYSHSHAVIAPTAPIALGGGVVANAMAYEVVVQAPLQAAKSMMAPLAGQGLKSAAYGFGIGTLLSFTVGLALSPISAKYSSGWKSGHPEKRENVDANKGIIPSEHNMYGIQYPEQQQKDLTLEAYWANYQECLKSCLESLGENSNFFTDDYFI